MGCTRVDLERWLREMHGDAVPSFAGDSIDLSVVGVPVRISVRDAPARSLGMIRFQELEVSFDFAPEAREAGEAWVHAFDRHTQRGGG